MKDEQDLHAIASESNEVVRIERLTHHIQRIRDSMDEMKNAMREMASAVTRLALVEERQAATSTAIDRLSDAIEKLDSRLREIERLEPLQSQGAEWTMKAVWAVAAAACTFAATKIFQ